MSDERLIAGEDIPPGAPWVYIGADGKVYPAVPVPPEWKAAMQAYNRIGTEIIDLLNATPGEAEKPETWRDREPLL